MVWYPNERDPQQQRGFDLFGQMLRRRRAYLGWTQRELEAYSGIDQTVISRLENGRQYGLRWCRLAELIDSLGGLDVGPGAPDPTGYVRGQPGAPRVDLSAGLASARDLDDWLEDP